MGVLQRVAFFCGIFTLQCCAAVLGNISRDTIFLRCYAASSISMLTLLLSFSSAYALTSVNQFLTRLARKNVTSSVLYTLCPAASACVIFFLSLVSLCFPFLERLVSVLIYVCHEIAVQLIAQQFWDLCAKAFDVSQSKKYFGFITFGTTFGSLLASFVVLPLVQSYGLPTEYNFFVTVFLFAFIAGVLYQSAGHLIASGVHRKNAKVGTIARRKTTNSDITFNKNNNDSTFVISEIQNRSYLKHICFFDLMATVIRVLIDNATLSQLALHDEEQVKSSLTLISGVQSFFMIPMQLASGPFFTYFGVMYGISLLPLTVFCFSLSTYLTKSVMSLVLARALYNAVSLALFNPARELLWLPFNVNERPKFKSFVSGPFRSLSRISGALLSMCLTSKIVIWYAGSSILSIVLMIFSIIWFLDALAAKKSYASEFYASLKKGYLDLTSPIVDFTPDQIFLIKETLISGAQNQINYVLSALSSRHIALFAPELRALFYRKNTPGNNTTGSSMTTGSITKNSGNDSGRSSTTSSSSSNVSDGETPLHTKLRLMNLHTAAKRQQLQNAQEATSFLLSTSSSLTSTSSTSISKISPHSPTNPPRGGLSSNSSLSSGSNGGGIFNTMDLMMLIKEKSSQLVPRQLRVAAILACGYEKNNEMDIEKCTLILRNLMQTQQYHQHQKEQEEDKKEDIVVENNHTKSMAICAAIVLLKLSNWLDEEANIFLQKMLHEEKDMDAKILCLKIVGKELPELLGDGFLVYLLHHSNALVVQAAVDCCTYSRRHSPMLIPALVHHLPNSLLRNQVLHVLKQFQPNALWHTLVHHLDTTIQLLEADNIKHKCKSTCTTTTTTTTTTTCSITTTKTNNIQHQRELLYGGLKLLETGPFPIENKLQILFELLNRLTIVPPPPPPPPPQQQQQQQEEEEEEINKNGILLEELFGKDLFLEEMVIDSLVTTLMSSSSSCNIKEDSSPPPKKNSKYSNDPLYVIILETKIKQAYQMKVFKQTFDQLLTKSASLPITCASKKEPNRQPLLIAHIDHCFQVVRRILLKLLSIEFPKEFNVQVLIEGLESDLVEIHETIQEVLENLIPSATYKHLVLPLFFSKNNFLPKIAQKIIKEIKKNQFETNFFKETQWILDMIKHDMSHEELYALAFEFYLEIHPQHQPINFSEEHFKRLLASEWTQELLVELAHETAAMIDGTTSTCSTGQEKNRILSDSIRDLLFKIPRPLISRVSISSCLRASALFENVCALDLLLMLSHRFGCKELDEGMTFATENDLATAMYIVASGRIQLHKNGKVLAELGYGACIGQAALLRHSLHAGNHVASATTLTKCLLLMVSREDLDALMKDVPRVSRGVLNAVASSLRWLYFEPLSELAQSGNLPSRRESKAMRYSLANHQERRHFASTTSAALSVDRAAKSFLHQIGRDRVSDPPLRTFATTSGEGSRSLKRSISHAITSTTTFDSQATASSTGVASTTESLVESSCTVEYTNFEKCIHLKGSQLMKNLDDEKVSLVANVSRVVTFGHGEVVYFDQHPADTVYIVIEGNIAVYRPQAKNDQQKETIKAKTQVFAEFHDGDCFGEESFVPGTEMYGQAISMGPSTLFEISTKELIELGELHADIMHVILAWLAQKVAQSAESLIVTSSSSSPSVTLKEKQIKNFSSPKLSKSVAGSQALTHRKTEPSRSRALST